MSKTEDTRDGDSTQTPATPNPLIDYVRQIWNYVLAPFLVDIMATGIVVLLLWGIAQCLVRVVLKNIGLTPSHVSQASALLGVCCLVAITITVARRFYYAAFRVVDRRHGGTASETNCKKEKAECSNSFAK